LREGCDEEVRAILLSAWVRGRAVADICDALICPAMRHIGQLWQHSEQGIFIEHRATDLCLQGLRQLQTLLPAMAPVGAAAVPGPDSGIVPVTAPVAPVAIGGAPSGDSYTLPSLMAATSLAAEGFHAMNLSAETPADVIAGAALQHGAKLAWIAISVARAEEEGARLVRHIRRVAERLREIGAHLVVGGRALPPGLVSRPEEHLHVLGSFPELAAFGRGLLAAMPG
jgi:methanogenic corrinoid protein MtbC1